MNKLLVVLMLAVMCGAQEKPKVKTIPAGDSCNTCEDDGSGILSCTAMLCESTATVRGTITTIDERDKKIAKLKQRISELEKENKELRAERDREHGILDKYFEEGHKRDAEWDAKHPVKRVKP